MSDERSLFDSFERLVSARLKCMETLALTVMKRTTILEDRVAALEKPQTPVEATPVEATPVESQRERNGRLLYLEMCLMRNSNVPVWDDTTSRQLRDNYITVAERFLVQVQPGEVHAQASEDAPGQELTITAQFLRGQWEVMVQDEQCIPLGYYGDHLLHVAVTGALRFAGHMPPSTRLER